MHQLNGPICVCYPHKNHASAWFIAQIIKLRANYPEYLIKSIRIDNAAKFSSKAFNYYCMALSINVEYFYIIYTYTKWISQISYQEINWQTIIKELQITISCWHHVVVQTVNLIQINLIAIISALPATVIMWNACQLCFNTYRYHHQGIHPWALRIRTRY